MTWLSDLWASLCRSTPLTPCSLSFHYNIIYTFIVHLSTTYKWPQATLSTMMCAYRHCNQWKGRKWSINELLLINCGPICLLYFICDQSNKNHTLIGVKYNSQCYNYIFIMANSIIFVYELWLQSYRKLCVRKCWDMFKFWVFLQIIEKGDAPDIGEGTHPWLS